jgi:hypothetical protein
MAVQPIVFDLETCVVREWMRGVDQILYEAVAP